MEGGSGREILCINPGLNGHSFTVGDAPKFIPAGSDIYFEIHYTSNGKATTDRARVGLILSKDRPQKRSYTSGALTNRQFTIPAIAQGASLRFNWQVGYDFEKPVPLPKGTRPESIAQFDTSPGKNLILTQREMCRLAGRPGTR